MLGAKPLGSAVTVVIAGELDHFAAPQIRRRLDELLEDQTITHLVLDLENLTFMDSSGIGMLLGRLRALQARGCTGWDQYWGTDAYYEGFPCLTEEAARFVAGLPLKGVGEDSISLDPCDTVDYPNHLTLFSAGLVNTENLKGLAQLIGWEFTFLTMPLKFENADGCSCRAAAIVTKEA